MNIICIWYYIFRNIEFYNALHQLERNFSVTLLIVIKTENVQNIGIRNSEGIVITI